VLLLCEGGMGDFAKWEGAVLEVSEEIKQVVVQDDGNSDKLA